MKEFSGKRFQVETEKVRLPNGHIMRLEKTDSKEVALVVPITDDNKMVVLKQYRPVIKKWIYEFPAGLVEHGEKPVSAAKREVEEETGFVCKNIKKLGGFFSSPGFSNEFIHVFVAECRKESEQRLEPAENILVYTLPAKKVIGMAKNGKFINGHALSALLLNLLHGDDFKLQQRRL